MLEFPIRKIIYGVRQQAFVEGKYKKACILGSAAVVLGISGQYSFRTNKDIKGIKFWKTGIRKFLILAFMG